MDHLNICIYGASSDEIDSIYIADGEALGKEIASHGHILLFGGGSYGLMGACARGAASAGGRVVGVMPYFMDEYEGIYRKCDEMIMTETMAERKALLEEMADAFVITPGGIGTMDEFFQVITLVELGRNASPIIIFNVNGFYDSILDFIDSGIEKGFIRQNVKDFFQVKTTAEGVVSAIEEAVK